MCRRKDAAEEKRIEELLAQMTLEEKVWLCHANSKFNAGGITRLGLEELSMSDGPHGVRYEMERNGWLCVDKEGSKCTYLPPETTLAATWNETLARRFGETLGSEARYRKKDIILGPSVNLIRTPLCGRNFEYMSEDPCLIEKLAPELVKGIEAQDTAACVKHYALNNQELDRGHVNVEVSKRALHELYLRGFYAAIIEGGASSVMGAYNRYEHQHCCHNQYLVNEVLKEKWGFDGVFLTDWGGCHDTEEAIFHGLDLEMGTNEPYEENYLADPFLKRANESEEVRELLDDKVRRILRLMLRIHKMNPDRKPGEYNTREHQQTAYDIASEAMVLLKNEDNVLPIDKEKVKKLLVAGPNAAAMHAEGGNSSGVIALYEITPLEGIRNRLEEVCEIEYERGCLSKEYHEIPVQQLNIIETKAGIRAFRLRYHRIEEETDTVFKTEYRSNASLRNEIADSLDIECSICIPETGKYGFQMNSSVGYTLEINGHICVNYPYDAWDAPRRIQRSRECTVDFTEGENVHLRIHIDTRKAEPLFDLGWLVPSDYNSDTDEETIWKKAAAADYVIYCGGLNHSLDTEGFDRSDMHLPLEQDSMIPKLAAVNPNTVVVLTAGSAVEMPWIDKVKAVLWTGYAGMEGGNALCDILTGDVCPSGKMPFTLPYQYEDTPAARYGEYKTENCKYKDDILVGYRGFEHDKIEPMFPFGHGNSYSEFSYSDLNICQKGDGAVVCFKVTNTGSVTAKETAQVYIGDPVCSVMRPPKELRNFKKVGLNPGETVEISLSVSARDLSFYDEITDDWKLEKGEYTVFVGSSSGDIRLEGSFII